MRSKIRGIFAAPWTLMGVAAITIAATVTMRPSTANAVEYVKICTIYGAGFFYLPGADICVNFATNDAREETVGGTWRWRIPNNPRTWLPAPQGSCQAGKLVKFGDINSAGLTQNSHSRFETNTQYQLKLKQGQYISSVFYQGGFTGVADGGNFCMYYYYNDPTNGPAYFPIGCIDTSPQATVPATLMFTPDSPIPPATSNQVSVLGAEGTSFQAISAADILGTLSIWLCVQNAH